MCQAASQLWPFSNTLPSPWTAFLFHSILYLHPTPTSSSFKFLLSPYLLFEAFLPSTSIILPPAHLGGVHAALQVPHSFLGRAVRQHLPSVLATACHFPFLSGVGPVTQILCLLVLSLHIWRT